MPLPPEATSFLCDAHRQALLPPHLEAFLRGETSQLLSTTKGESLAASAGPGYPIGVDLQIDAATVNALMAAGMSFAEVAAQQMAMLNLQQNNQRQQAPAMPTRASEASQNEMLDRENHIVAELVTDEEWNALQETGAWPLQFSNFSVSISIQESGKFSFSSIPCRDCDPTGSSISSCLSIKNRSRARIDKTRDKARVPSLEY